MFRFLGSKRFWKRLAIVCCLIVALLLMANGIMTWRTNARLQTKLAAIRAAGGPASIADLAPEPIPNEQNAAAILQQAAPRIRAFADEHGRFFNTPIGRAYNEARNRGDVPTLEQIEAIRAVVEKYPDVEDAFVSAAACEQYASLADFSLGPQQFIEATLNGVQDIRSVGRFVPWRMRILIADNELRSIRLTAQ